jgi:hypothetical protein
MAKRPPPSRIVDLPGLKTGCRSIVKRKSAIG